MRIVLSRGGRGRRRSRARTALFLGAAVLVAALSLTLFFANALRGLEAGSVDRRFSIRPEQPAPKDFVVVGVDAKTFSDLELQWPFPRQLHGEVIDRLRRDGAHVVVVDLEFNAPSRDIEADNALIAAVRRTPRIALATTAVDNGGRTQIFGGGEGLRYSRASVGHALFPNDPGGTIRRMQHTVDGLATLPVVTARLASGRKVAPADLGGASAWIDFRGPPGTFTTRSYSDVLQGKFPPGAFRDKIVVFGPSAPVLHDVHPTSTSGDSLMSGAELQANAIWTALNGFPLQPLPRWLGGLVVLLMALAAPLAFLRLKARFAAVALALLCGAYLVAAQLLFDAGTILPLVTAFAALGLGLVAALGVLIATGAFERERVRDMFARFVPESVVNEVLAKVDDDLRLGGERRVATVMFSDLRGFTTYADTRSPDEVIDVLNRYLTAMSDVILDYGGTLVAYMGDGIMAVYGAPIEQEDHAERALAAARDMTGPALEKFNAWMRESGKGPGFRMGVGLNSGVVMSGQVGSERRLEYATIGDTTNTSARLESMTKGTPYAVFVSDQTRAMLREPPDDVVFVDSMEIRGKQNKLVVWGILDPITTLEPAPPSAAEPGPEPAPPALA